MPFTASLSFSDICKIILAIILPPLGVFLERGCNADFFINILLTILGYIPGIIHALYVLVRCLALHDKR
ncbi:plasma membrane proteolipid 3 [Capronia epimyces CBS 606.96]|uniref:Plasma membrane proteolipid 3 n=1 Tax=Capronia epimyces CBS 606.96 TaxID=1182542 RepID=W9XAC2_9EURO|nr:plasma membrane proteolipid 3 [Capronia epimyces CBS 606.96]EXJ77198.1 plasma membrane proteolipid 3 [Capronia epimyces CBS 606.96]